MATQKVIILEKHMKDCAAVNAVLRGDWDTPWFMHGEIQKLDSRGQKRSNWYRWQPFICSDTQCPANGIVLIDWLEKLVYVGSKSAAQTAKAEDAYNS